MNRPIKKVAFKRNIAIPITAGAGAAMGGFHPRFDFERDSARATSGFLGKAQRPASEDWERVRIEDFPGFDYIAWDSRYVPATSGPGQAP